MPIRDLVYRIKARNETDEGASGFERALTSTFGRLALAAAAIGAALAKGIASAALDAEDRIRELIRRTGQDSAQQEQLFISLLDRGTTAENAQTAIAALAAGGGSVGVGLGDTAIARLLADYSTVGGDPSNLLATLAQFGAQGPEDVYARGNIIAAGGLASPKGVQGTTTALRDYGPVLGQAGFSDLESLALITDLNQQGVDISRVGPGLNQFLRGGGDRAGLEDVQSQVVGASTPEEALQIATEAFGAEGAVRLTRALRGGSVGFGAEDLSLGHLGGSLNLAAVAEPTGREAYTSAIEASEQAGGFRRFSSSLAVSDVPVIGDVTGTIGASLIDTDRAGAGTLAGNEAILEVLLDHERRIQLDKRSAGRSGLDVPG